MPARIIVLKEFLTLCSVFKEFVVKFIVLNIMGTGKERTFASNVVKVIPWISVGKFIHFGRTRF